MRTTHIPLRLVTGAFILNAGWGKRTLDHDRAAGLQAMATRVIPPAGRIKPERFGKMLSYAEMTLGTALLAPFIPSRIAGAGLGIFSGSLFTMYLRTPGMTLDDGIRPTPQGTASVRFSAWPRYALQALPTHEGRYGLTSRSRTIRPPGRGHEGPCRVLEARVRVGGRTRHGPACLEV